MTFVHQPTITIDGVDYTGDTIETVSVTRGRDVVYAEPQPGFASVTLIDRTGAGLPITVGSTVIIDLAPGRTIFRGTITDWTARLYDPGILNTPAGTVTITAVGPLMRLNRRIIYFGGRQAEKDAERIRDIIETALAVPWEEASGIWDDAVGSWEDYLAQPYDPALIDPGVFDIAALDPQEDGYVALTAAQLAASSGAGIVFETGDGFIGFANADRRTANRAAGPYEIPAGVVTATLETRSQLADIINRLLLTYAGGAVEVEDIDSIQRFGVYADQLDTQLVDLGNAEARADDYLARHAIPTVQMPTVSIRLDGLDTTVAGDILDLDLNDAVLVPVPNTLGPTSRLGFIEQIVTVFDPFRAEVVLNVSDFRLSDGTQRWGQVDPTLAWEDVAATLEWQDATTVTA